MQLASRFGHVNQIRRERPLTREELMYHVPSIFGEDRHTSRSERYAYIPTITVLENLQREGFQPFFACQTRVRDQSRREYTKHMLRLRRAGQITGQHVPEIILLNSHDGSSSYQMLPGYFRAICTNGLVCGQSLGEVRVPHRGNVVEKVIEGAYEVVGVFDRIEEKRDAMQSLVLPPPARQALAQAALTYRYGDEHQPVTTADILTPRRREDYGNRLHYLADRAGIRGLFSDADAYHLDQAFPLLMKQLELMLTSGELNPRHQHTVTLYAKGLTCDADTLGSCGYVYLAVYPTPETKK